MIHRMREMAPTIMLIILIAFVGGTIFLDWGMNVSGKRSASSVAGKVNGKEIPLSYFDKQVNMERQKLQQNQNEVPPNQYRVIPDQVWEREVNRVLMLDVVNKMKLGASADEVFEYIKRNPLPGIDTVSAFQTSGVFDTSKYVEFLNNPENYDYHTWLRDIEAYTREVIVPAQKLEVLLNAGVFPSKAEIENNYRTDKQKAVFEYVKVNKNLLDIDTSGINDQMIKNYYEAHKDTFNTDEQVSVYYVKFPKVPTANDDRIYNQELVELKKNIESSEEPLDSAFAIEARIGSDDQVSAAQGGDLGWFGNGTMVPVFDSIAFSIDTGKISDPVKTRFGYHLILVEKREMKDGQLKVKARHILRKITPTMETIDMLAGKADSLRNKILDKGLMEAIKDEDGLQFDSTSFFKKGDQIPGVGYVSGSGQFLFGDEKGTVSERLENDQGIYLLSVKQKVKKGTLPFDLVKDDIRTNLIDSVKEATARAYAEGLLKKINKDSSLANLKETDPMVISGTTDTVSVSDYIPEMGTRSKVAAVATTLSPGQVSDVIEHQNNLYIVKTLWKNSVDSIPWGSYEVKQTADRLTQQTTQRIYYDWYTGYKDNAKITSNIENYYMD